MEIIPSTFTTVDRSRRALSTLNRSNGQVRIIKVVQISTNQVQVFKVWPREGPLHEAARTEASFVFLLPPHPNIAEILFCEPEASVTVMPFYNGYDVATYAAIWNQNSEVQLPDIFLWKFVHDALHALASLNNGWVAGQAEDFFWRPYFHNRLSAQNFLLRLGPSRVPHFVLTDFAHVTVDVPRVSHYDNWKIQDPSINDNKFEIHMLGGIMVSLMATHLLGLVELQPTPCQVDLSTHFFQSRGTYPVDLVRDVASLCWISRYGTGTRFRNAQHAASEIGAYAEERVHMLRTWAPGVLSVGVDPRATEPLCPSTQELNSFRYTYDRFHETGTLLPPNPPPPRGPLNPEFQQFCDNFRAEFLQSAQILWDRAERQLQQQRLQAAQAAGQNDGRVHAGGQNQQRIPYVQLMNMGDTPLPRSPQIAKGNPVPNMVHMQPLLDQYRAQGNTNQNVSNVENFTNQQPVAGTMRALRAHYPIENPPAYNDGQAGAAEQAGDYEQAGDHEQAVDEGQAGDHEQAGNVEQTGNVEQAGSVEQAGDEELTGHAEQATDDHDRPAKRLRQGD